MSGSARRSSGRGRRLELGAGALLDDVELGAALLFHAGVFVEGVEHLLRDVDRRIARQIVDKGRREARTGRLRGQFDVSGLRFRWM